MVSKEEHVDRNRWSASAAILVALVTLIISGSVILLRVWKSGQAHVSQRAPLSGLGYCSSPQVTPCIVSFSLDSDGKMLVSFLTDGAFYPDFYLKIRQGENENIYQCRKVNKFATSVYCTGMVMPLGEILQFLIISKNEDVLLAEGNFAIIGLALGTPEIFSSPTLGTPSPTEGPILTTPTQVTLTPRPSPTSPSYPGPPYP
jgi:hypothetical protein